MTLQQLSNHKYVAKVVFKDGKDRTLEADVVMPSGSFIVFVTNPHTPEQAETYVNGDAVQTIDVAPAMQTAGAA